MFSLAKTFDDERFKRIVAVLIALLTVIAALIALLQSDASARDDRANRDTKRYATEAMGRKVSGDARVNFDYNSAYQAWYELDTLATSATSRGDDAAAQRYITQRDEMTSLSPLLAAQYFDPATGQPDVARYEADVYLVEMTTLNENFLAASVVKDGWDSKANAYVFHLTLLAVAFFLFGLSITIASSITRWIFAGVGTIAAVAVISMAVSTWVQPVFDLRERGDTITAYASGVGLAHQDRWTEAIAAFDQAIQTVPGYTNALVARAQAYGQAGNQEQAIADYERARAAGNESASVAGELAWAYYLQNRYDDATAMNRTALMASPDELWIQFDLGLGLLASGQVDAAKAEYSKGMEFATKQVADARAAGNEVPSFLWWSLDDAALQIDTLTADVEDGTSVPLQASASQDLMQQLKSLAVGLENTGKPPEGAIAATISPFTFSAPATDDQGNAVEPLVGDSFPEGTDEVLVEFDYDAMQDGQEVFYKVYIDGEEDPSWRLLGPWDLGVSGTAEKPLSLAYSDVFVLNPGEYTVEMYVNSHLAQSGWFVVEGGE
ncbi:MAG: tetratricopeptide repeat protein [Roseiflexaceae bacterium]|nr:tetratricopeptide repeat protein [Roseiflexaceae bacterium]